MENKTSTKIKIYYQKSTGYVCYRYPNNYLPENETDFIELSEDDAIITYQCPYGKIWVVQDEGVVLIDDVVLQSTPEYQAAIKKEEMISLKQYLADTDYVVAKLQEAQLEDEEEYNTLKVKYADILVKRKEARVRIRELEGDK